MPSVLAIVSKAVFERDAKIGGKLAGVGEVVPFDRYVSKNKGIAPAAEGGAIFLVTVRPPDENLWLVGVLEAPTFDGESWKSAKNTIPITDISSIKDAIVFVTGTGISAKKGALGMSLQTPRVLADADVVLLRGGRSSASKGHLNAHERGGPTPCLCRKCIDSAPETVTVSDLVLVRERAEAKGRFLWFWMPERLQSDREAIRRAVASRLFARKSSGRGRDAEDLDKVFAGGAAAEGAHEDEDNEDDE
jgi:hypothetical protein